MSVGEVLLAAFVGYCLQLKLSAPELWKFISQKSLRKQLVKWKKTLQMLQAVADKAEEKQLTDQTVIMWLHDLRELAYDIEDSLDEFSTTKVRKQIGGITSLWPDTYDRVAKLGLQRNQQGPSTNLWQRTESRCLPNGAGMFGRDEDTKKILELILHNATNHDASFDVIPIVGKAGAGKPTYACSGCTQPQSC
ncbi:unnamed protein product [Dovyalis caffra]|uniref:Disease resistance N-terminal domain-containing protein n=1 Tax=Dovyalis caffra TaxID=77055 RepID=A0AAV1RUI4_9ROSI|nr:unnamed protein product [Dovyalis caffra]